MISVLQKSILRVSQIMLTLRAYGTQKRLPENNKEKENGLAREW